MKTEPTVVFVCLHGSAKSLVAASLAEQAARESGKAIRFASAGMEPDASVPRHVVEGLRTDGVDVSAVIPNRATHAALACASLAASFGPDISGIIPAGVPVERWEDVPLVSDGYAPARDAIRRKPLQLLQRL